MWQQKEPVLHQGPARARAVRPPARRRRGRRWVKARPATEYGRGPGSGSTGLGAWRRRQTSGWPYRKTHRASPRDVDDRGMGGVRQDQTIRRTGAYRVRAIDGVAVPTHRSYHRTRQSPGFRLFTQEARRPPQRRTVSSSQDCLSGRPGITTGASSRCFFWDSGFCGDVADTSWPCNPRTATLGIIRAAPATARCRTDKRQK